MNPDTHSEKDVMSIFTSIDSMDISSFIDHLTPDINFIFGNQPTVTGRENVRDSVTRLFSTIAGITHHISHIWDVEIDATIVWMDVEYRRMDGKVIVVPSSSLLRWEQEKVREWQIVIDVTPVYR